MDPLGLMNSSREDGREGIIFVAINYRLGMFGWLRTHKDGDAIPNLGLYDQRLALDW